MSTILLVDDEEPNRALIRAYLADSGYDIVDATSGDEALAVVARVAPDLVLLDVLMPGLDGFEVTRRLKEGSGPLFLPVVLVTALTDQASRRRGLRAGADDFLSKPVDPQELIVRVRNLLSLRDKERALAEKNAELAELSRFKREVTALLVHDLKSPIAASMATIEYALDVCQCPGDVREALTDAHAANEKVMAMVTDLLQLERLEAAKLVPDLQAIDLGALVAPIVAVRRWEAARRSVSLDVRLAEGLVVDGDPRLVARVLDNLLDNAFRHTPGGGRLLVEAVSAPGGGGILRVGNDGAPIPLAQRSLLFDKFARGGSAGAANAGFGLYFCKLALEVQGGRITIDDSAELATVFAIELPGPSPLPGDAPRSRPHPRCGTPAACRTSAG